MSNTPVEDKRAGGGAGELNRTVQTVNETMRNHLLRIFTLHANSGFKAWNKEQIQAFIKGIQQQNDSPTVDQLLAKDELDFEGFLTWMTSSNGAITTPPTMEDLSWPLSTYFISSSHNTYLTGNQLYSDSSTKPYTDTLLRGGRCIEIDVWDGSESDVDTSDSSSSSDEEQTGTRGEKKPKSQKRKKSKLGFLKEKLPDVVASKLEKTSIGKKIDERDAKKAGETASTIPTATKTTTDTKTTATATTTDVKTTATTTTDATTATTDTATITGQATTQEPEPEPEPAAAVVEPRVLHGYTLTKEIRFRAVCESIRDSAFVVSNLPVIVSLEVHCSAEQQLVMVRIMREVFDGLLVAEPENDSPEVLPSPDELRGKLLIKVKYAPPPGTTTATEEESEEDDRAPAATAETANNKEATAAKKAPKIIQELSKMGIFTRGVSFKSLDQPEVGMASHVFSLSEKKVIDVHEKQAAELFNHNRHYLMRTYPWGLRIGSSNLDPSLFWRKGIQIVALNWQRWDEGMMLNEGMFAGTGGWVLKPEGYRPDLESKKSPDTIIRKTLNLVITILAAQNIPLPPGDSSARGFEPYVKIELHVEGPSEAHGGPIPDDGHEREGEYKARSRTYKGVDVDFATGDRLEFPPVPAVMEELSWVRFTVRDDEIGRDDLAAWACVRLDRLGQGYRFVHLLDCEGRLTKGVMLVKVEKSMV